VRQGPKRLGLQLLGPPRPWSGGFTLGGWLGSFAALAGQLARALAECCAWMRDANAFRVEPRAAAPPMTQNGHSSPVGRVSSIQPLLLRVRSSAHVGANPLPRRVDRDRAAAAGCPATHVQVSLKNGDGVTGRVSLRDGLASLHLRSRGRQTCRDAGLATHAERAASEIGYWRRTHHRSRRVRGRQQLRRRVVRLGERSIRAAWPLGGRSGVAAARHWSEPRVPTARPANAVAVSPVPVNRDPKTVRTGMVPRTQAASSAEMSAGGPQTLSQTPDAGGTPDDSRGARHGLLVQPDFVRRTRLSGKVLRGKVLKKMVASSFDEVMERSHTALLEIARGNARPFVVMYSEDDDVTLATPFGGVARGRARCSRCSREQPRIIATGTSFRSRTLQHA
jgi:hypothetical protein